MNSIGRWFASAAHTLLQAASGRSTHLALRVAHVADGCPALLCTTKRLGSNNSRGSKEFEAPSPYKPGVVSLRHGYKVKHFDGGLLPRPKDSKVALCMPEYKPKDNWSPKHALFGQNDYIDILGDGRIHPKELIRGPQWLVGFRGNEMQRIIRRLHFTGSKLKAMRPQLHNNLQKQLRYFYFKKNLKRSKTIVYGRHVG